MKIIRLSDEKIADYKSLGMDLSYQLIDDQYIYEVNERTARWIIKAIEFGKSEAKRELKDWMGIK